MGNMLTMRPDLFGAVVAHVPLFDMRRYHRLPAGATLDGRVRLDPDDLPPKSEPSSAPSTPYHNVEAGFRASLSRSSSSPTSTRDDTVCTAGHARKMAAKMLAMGHDVLYHENVEGGHAGAADQCSI